MKRNFLFLQGPIGPCFRLLSEHLVSKGHTVTKINFWGGDVFGFPKGVPFRGTAEAWPAWIARIVQQQQITDVVLFGDMRPRHREAINLLKDRIPRIYVLEEGYYRPDWITVDRGGSNVNSALPRSISKYTYKDGAPVPKHDAVHQRIWQAVPLVMRSYALGLLLTPFSHITTITVIHIRCTKESCGQAAFSAAPFAKSERLCTCVPF